MGEFDSIRPYRDDEVSAVLSRLSQDPTLLDLLMRPKRGEEQQTSRKKTAELLADTRKRGYSIDNEEFSDGVSCVAAPIYDGDGRMAAAIGLSGPAARNNPARLAELGELLLEHSKADKQPEIGSGT